MAGPRRAHIPNFGKVVKAVDETVREVAERRVRTFAEDEREAFVKRVEAQDFEAFDAIPLNPTYRAWKIKQGLDPRVMIRTRHYLGSIKVFARRNSDGSVTYHVGFHRRALARDAKGKRIPFLLRRLAYVQEKGSVKANIPARPHWRPHYQAMHRRAPTVRRRIRREIVAALKKKLAGFA